MLSDEPTSTRPPDTAVFYKQSGEGEVPILVNLEDRVALHGEEEGPSEDTGNWPAPFGFHVL